MNDKMVFLDSGAYSAKTQGLEINMQDYIAFIKAGDFQLYANLDVIGDEKATWKNQQIMEAEGLKPLPVFHMGEDIKYLKKYIERYEYISIGGLTTMTMEQLKKSLEGAFEMMKDDKGAIRTKVHGFGITSFHLMQRFPWYTLDSNSPTLSAAYGRIYLPTPKQGGFDFLNPIAWAVSDQSKGHQVGVSSSYTSAPELLKQKWKELFDAYGFTFGEIEYRERRATRKERKKNTNIPKQEPMDLIQLKPSAVVGNELVDSWEERLRWNLIMWQRMQDNLPARKHTDGSEFQTTIYTVASSPPNLRVVRKVAYPTRVLVSYAYLRHQVKYLEQVLKYQEYYRRNPNALRRAKK